VENAYAESFDEKFRDKCLNEHWFLDLAEARQKIEAWRIGGVAGLAEPDLGGAATST
jgi:Integrase core domain